MVISNLKQQVQNLQSELKSKDEDLLIFNKQIEDYRQKMKSTNDELACLEDKIKSNAVDITNYQNIKEDLENKVCLFLNLEKLK
jgi:peptidoglycan hydrolase CwlO-like protein